MCGVFCCLLHHEVNINISCKVMTFVLNCSPCAVPLIFDVNLVFYRLFFSDMLRERGIVFFCA